MTNPVIFITDPTTKDYTTFLTTLLPRLANASSLDIVILTPITHSHHLNAVLFKYYQLVSSYVESHPAEFDYRFATGLNVLFNLSPDKITHLSSRWNHAYAAEAITVPVPTPLTQLNTEIPETPIIEVPATSRCLAQFRTCAVGGTFDHLHAGHKILLSMSLFLASRKLIVGITGPELLKNKKYLAVLEPYAVRQAEVLKFVLLIHPGSGMGVEVYEINDVCGPTGYVSDIDCLVISDETRAGGEFVNKYRKEQGFRELDILSIKVIGDADSTSDNSWKGKLSSTDIREREYKRLHPDNV
ncbi:Phosphopantetheine adenylyltransferase [Candida viswanathii]|uniref:Phosphopantetheine adenylyltransferase n=1 Tax=Candida viswanathii TaxID=5486 RepID=A0A367XQJ7_9ASCO|nr:Phosphopantetheine adenylyltransferase [Candida viswanathii]